jgi:hypothetical protein
MNPSNIIGSPWSVHQSPLILHAAVHREKRGIRGATGAGGSGVTTDDGES